MLSKIVFILLAIFYGSFSRADRIDIAVASNFMMPMKDIVEHFETVSSGEVRVSYASSGKIFAQVINGAPYDIFSADQEKPRQLIDRGLADPSSLTTYAVGALALWTANKTLGKVDEALLLSKKYKRVAIANPRLAPYGVAAMSVLHKFNLVDQLKGRLILAENVSQVFQFAASENVDLGFVALSQIKQLDVENSRVWVVPQKFHAPIKQDAVKMRRTSSSDLADKFMRFLRSPLASDILRSYGYIEPTVSISGAP